jgi:hypothetical protein
VRLNIPIGSKKKKKKKKLPACRGELLAARALSLRCAVSAVLTIHTGYA